MDQLFPRALLSICPFSLVLETAVKLLEQGKSRRETKEGEKREKRKHETAGLPTTMGSYNPLCQWRSTVDYRFDSLETETSSLIVRLNRLSHFRIWQFWEIRIYEFVYVKGLYVHFGFSVLTKYFVSNWFLLSRRKDINKKIERFFINWIVGAALIKIELTNSRILRKWVVISFLSARNLDCKVVAFCVNLTHVAGIMRKGR